MRYGEVRSKEKTNNLLVRTIWPRQSPQYLQFSVISKNDYQHCQTQQKLFSINYKHKFNLVLQIKFHSLGCQHPFISDCYIPRPWPPWGKLRKLQLLILNRRWDTVLFNIIHSEQLANRQLKKYKTSSTSIQMALNHFSVFFTSKCCFLHKFHFNLKIEDVPHCTYYFLQWFLGSDC